MLPKTKKKNVLEDVTKNKGGVSSRSFLMLFVFPEEDTNLSTQSLYWESELNYGILVNSLVWFRLYAQSHSSSNQINPQQIIILHNTA
jgi:hypothetical protein